MLERGRKLAEFHWLISDWKMLSVIHQTSLLTESILSLKKIETVHRLHPSLLYESLDGLFSAVIPQPSWKPKQFIWVNCSVGSCGSCNSHRSCEPTSLNQNSEWNRSAKSLVAASQGVSELFRILLIICRSMAFFRLNEFSLFKKRNRKVLSAIHRCLRIAFSLIRRQTGKNG